MPDRVNALTRSGKVLYLGFNNFVFERMVCMAFLFNLDLIKVSQEERVIINKEGKEDGKYYVVGLSNGQKSFEVTCGEKNNLLKVPVFSGARVYFDIVDKKLKAVDADAIAKGGNQ